MTTPNPYTIGTDPSALLPPGVQQAQPITIAPEPPLINPIPPNIDTVAATLTDLYNRVNSIENWMSNGMDQRPRPFVVLVQEISNRLMETEQAANRVVTDLNMKMSIVETVLEKEVKVEMVDSKTKLVAIEAEVSNLRLQLIAADNQLNNLVDQLNNAVKSGTIGGPSSTSAHTGDRNSKKVITEYKIINGLKTLGSDKKLFRSWLEDFKNAVDQVDPVLRGLLETIENQLWGNGEEKDWIDKENEIRTNTGYTDEDWSRAKRDMYAVLMNKTETDARQLVRNKNRDGLMSYMRMTKWYTELSGAGMADRKRAVLRPDKCKKEEDIFARIEKWEEEIREIERVTGETLMGEIGKKTGLKDICCGRIEDWIDLKEEQLTYQQLRDEAVKFSLKQRKDSTKLPTAAQMDVGSLIDALKKNIHDGTSYHPEGKGQDAESEYQQRNPADEFIEMMLNAVGKGKGKDKGEKGNIKCYNCGGNHLARNCPNPQRKSKGEGKGKGGKDASKCYNCGRIGHHAWQCRLPSSKGKGKDGKKGKGKGQYDWKKPVNAVEEGGKEVNLTGDSIKTDTRAAELLAEPVWGEGYYDDNDKWVAWDSAYLLESDDEPPALSENDDSDSSGAQCGCTRGHESVRCGGKSSPPMWFLGAVNAQEEAKKKKEERTRRRELEYERRLALENMLPSKGRDCMSLESPGEREALEQMSSKNVEERKKVREEKAKQMCESGKYQRVKVCPDSGAVKFVAPPTFAPLTPLEESEESKRGRGYRVANGGWIPNQGQKTIRAKDINNNTNNSTWQIANVTKPLAGIPETVKASNKVVFDEENGVNVSYIYNKNSRVLIPIEREGNQYEFDMFIPAVGETKVEPEVMTVQTEVKRHYEGRWELLEEDESNKESPALFQRLVSDL